MDSVRGQLDCICFVHKHLYLIRVKGRRGSEWNQCENLNRSNRPMPHPGLSVVGIGTQPASFMARYLIVELGNVSVHI